MSLSCFRLKKRGDSKKRPDSLALSSLIQEIEISLVPSKSGMNTNLPNFVKELIVQLADELYALARKKIGGTVIVYHLREETTDWHATKDTFISLKLFNRRYQPGAFKKIFTSKGPEENFHDGAVIFNLANGLIDSVSAKLFMVKHDCEDKCANRGTRHTSACCFRNFTPVPIVVISEEKGQVSLFLNGCVQYGIKKEDLKKELLKAYVKQEDSCLAYAAFDVQHFTTLYDFNPFIPNDDGHKWFFKCYMMNMMDLHKGTQIKLGKEVLNVSPENPTDYAKMESYVEYNAKTRLKLYIKRKSRCFILTHGFKRLGGFFYKVVGDIIVIENLFLLRQLLHNGFAGRLLFEVLLKMYHPECTKLVFFVPPDLTGRYANLIEAVKAEKDPSLLEKYELITHINVGYSAKLS